MYARLALICCLAIVVVSCATRTANAPLDTSRGVPSVDGQWTLTVESPMGREQLAATFAQSGAHLTGMLSGAAGEVPIEGRVEGNQLQFEMSLDVRGQPLLLDYVGTVEGDTMSGTVQFGPIGTGKFSGVRKM